MAGKKKKREPRSPEEKKRRSQARRMIAGTAAGAAVVGAVPIPITDSALLVPLQLHMLTRIARIYGMERDSAENAVIDNIIKVGATTMAGRTILSALKGVPGIHLAASVLNALVAGTVTYAAGEISAMVFEGIQRGTIDPKTIDWARYIEVLYREKMPEYTELIQEALEKRSAEDVVKNLVKILGRKEKKDSDSGMQNDAGGDR
ncbi:MAG TPA: hypothetical protein DCG70_05235 [Lachnoclostridium sp.]|nr:hypothetical protein [Lachnoclostridium sp.]